MPLIVARDGFPLPRAVAPDVELFAIGDIHGCADLLEALLDVAAREPKQARRRELVFLGDLIDRGPDNLGTIDLALGAAGAIGADEATWLMGNHEIMMRMALDPSTPKRVALGALRSWRANGGVRTIEELLNPLPMPPDLDELRQAVHECLPMDVEHWLGDLAPNARSGDVLFVHAGLNPRRAQEAFLATPWNRSLANLAEASHWAWIRRPFLDHEPGPSGWEGFFVVHGHTPNDGRVGASHEDQIRRFRLNLDGGSAVTGVAKMGIFRGAFVDVVTVQCGGHEPGATPVRPVRRDA